MISIGHRSEAGNLVVRHLGPLQVPTHFHLHPIAGRASIDLSVKRVLHPSMTSYVYDVIEPKIEVALSRSKGDRDNLRIALVRTHINLIYLIFENR